MSDQSNPWKTNSSKQIYKNSWITVTEHQVTKPNGEPGIYGVVDTRIATGVLALTDDMRIYLVGQYRYPTNMYSWELPEGGTDEDEKPMDAAKRELREEAGVIAESWEQLGGEIHLSNCFTSERGFLFLARNLKQVASQPEDTEVLSVKIVTFKEALAMVDSGEIVDAISIIGILRAQRYLKI